MIFLRQKTLMEKEKMLVTTPFPQFFKILPSRGHFNSKLCSKWNAVDNLSDKNNCRLVYNNILNYKTTLSSKDPKEGGSENIVRKGGNAGKQHFLLFPQ